jgi:hypothetical protein
MEHAKKIDSCGTWDHVPEQIISLITVKVAQTSDTSLKDIQSAAVQQGDEEGDLEPHRHQPLQPRVALPLHSWGDADTLDAYLNTIDWLQCLKNGGALFIKGMGSICIGFPSGVSLLTRAEEEGDQQAAYVLAVLKYYKHGSHRNLTIFENLALLAHYYREGHLQRFKTAISCDF